MIGQGPQGIYRFISKPREGICRRLCRLQRLMWKSIAHVIIVNYSVGPCGSIEVDADLWGGGKVDE
jgi:hypothetical protein